MYIPSPWGLAKRGTPEPDLYMVRAYAAVVAQRDEARKWAAYMSGAAVMFFALWLWAYTHPPQPKPVACPDVRETMQLDPTVIRGSSAPGVWL